MKNWDLRHTVIRFLPLGLLVALFITLGMIGLDFGHHWDEQKYQIGEVKHMMETDTLLPRIYIYPSLAQWIEASGLIPYMVEAKTLKTPFGKTLVWFKNYLLHAVDSKTYLLEVRALFLILCSLSLVWTYLAVLSVRGKHEEAFLAAALVGFSWEVGYHSRWIATDGLLLSLGALVLFLFTLAVKNARALPWLAVACGLGAGVKYPGGVLVLVLFIALALAPSLTWKERFRAAIRTGALTAITFFLTTPGALIQPRLFWIWVSAIREHYQSGPHGGYNILPGISHATRIIDYLSTTFFSPYPAVSLICTALMVIGGVAVIRKREKVGIVCVAISLLYVAYFSQQVVMIVRNLLVLAPFLAYLGSRGAFVLMDAIGYQPARLVLQTGVAALLLINLNFLVHAAESIPGNSSEKQVSDLIAYLQMNPSQTFSLSEQVKKAVNNPKVVSTPALEAENFVFFASEAKFTEWPANLPRQTVTWFGPREVNFNIYPSWDGADRIVVMKRADYLKVPMLESTPDLRRLSLRGSFSDPKQSSAVR